MRTRSSSNLIVESSTIPKQRNRRRSKQIVEPEFLTIVETPVATMADTHTMSELLQAPTEGYRDAIFIPPILAKNFELKVELLSLITSMLKYKNVPHEAIKLMLFPFSLEGAARIWLEKEPPRSIHTWEDLVSKFVNYFFPPSKTTNLKNDITNFQQRFDETFNSINEAVGGNLLNHTPRDALTINENKLKVHILGNKLNVSKVSTTTSTPSPSSDVTALTEIVKELVLMNKATQQATVKAIEETCVTCGGPHPYYECLAADGNTFDAYAAKESPSGSGSLPSNTISNPRGDLKAITTRSGVSYDGPTIPPTSYPLPKVVERDPKATNDKVQTIAHVQPLVVQVPIPEPDVASKPNPKPSIPYPSRLNDQKL
ncbi:reverse transcriptase domain-containing protein [Tanacetum coccineum]